MADVIRDVVVRIGLEQDKGAKLQAPNVKTATEAVEKFKTSVKGSTKQVEDSLKKTEGAWKKQREAIEKAGAAQGKTSKAIVDGNLKAADSFKLAGEGAFTFARGIALVGISGSEDLQKTLVVIAKFQGAFDIFKGGTDVIKGTLEGVRALRTASQAAAVGQVALAAGNTAVATTATTAAVATTSLNLALGPVGLTLIGITLAVGAAAAAWRVLGRDAPEAIRKTNIELKKTEDQLDANFIASEKARESTIRLGRGRETAEALAIRQRVELARTPEEKARILRTGIRRLEQQEAIGATRERRGEGPAGLLADKTFAEERRFFKQEFGAEGFREIEQQLAGKEAEFRLPFAQARAQRTRTKQEFQRQLFETERGGLEERLETLTTARERLAAERSAIAKQERARAGRFGAAPIDRFAIAGLEAKVTEAVGGEGTAQELEDRLTAAIEANITAQQRRDEKLILLFEQQTKDIADLEDKAEQGRLLDPGS